MGVARTGSIECHALQLQDPADPLVSRGGVAWRLGGLCEVDRSHIHFCRQRPSEDARLRIKLIHTYSRWEWIAIRVMARLLQRRDDSDTVRLVRFEQRFEAEQRGVDGAP